MGSFTDWKNLRNIGTFLLGLGIAFHEVFQTDGERPYVLGFAALCLGLVATWKIDEARKQKNGNGH